MVSTPRANGGTAAGTEEAYRVSPGSGHLNLCRKVKKLNVAVRGYLGI